MGKKKKTRIVFCSECGDIMEAYTHDGKEMSIKEAVKYIEQGKKYTIEYDYDECDALEENW